MDKETLDQANAIQHEIESLETTIGLLRTGVPIGLYIRYGTGLQEVEINSGYLEDIVSETIKVKEGFLQNNKKTLKELK